MSSAVTAPVRDLVLCCFRDTDAGGLRCQDPAVHAIVWKDGGISPACAKHADVLSEIGRAKVYDIRSIKEFL